MPPSGFVMSSDGTRIAVYDTGNQNAPATVLAVHGYPDNASVWDAVTERLAVDHRVLRYDVRGTGRSDKPRGRRAYRFDRLTEDLDAVLAGFSPDRPVHLLAHDWGSVQGWHFAGVRPDRFSGFTSVSGPNVAYLRPWIRTNLAARNWRPVLRQLLHSTYIGFFKLPVLPELAWRSGLIDRIMARSEPPADRSLADKINGLELYRANLLTRHAEPPRPIRIPVQVIAPTGDAYIGGEVAHQTPRPWVADLTVATVESGHWVPLTEPDYLAQSVAAFIRR